MSFLLQFCPVQPSEAGMRGDFAGIGVGPGETIDVDTLEFPPVDAFWSLTMYNLPQQLLVKNPINRYLINSPMLPNLKLDAEGGLNIYIQSDSPGNDKESNWLPAPKAPFMLAMRYYLPKPELIQGTWKSPPVVRAN